eukprot:768782-Hanusia_phi.AAC.6
MPQQFTTCSHRIVPRGVTTPFTAPSSTITCVTGVPSKICPPCMRVPLPSAMVTSTGLTRPSPGT